MQAYLDAGLLDRAVTENKKIPGGEKIIFLDIDGVMHDYSNYTDVQEERVERLKQIVTQTGAEIILSSSWRFGYQEFLEDNDLMEYASGHISKSLIIFQGFLKKYDLEIAGFTPYSSLGENGRPLEIRRFLLDKPNIRSFVILDDDDFNWQWLRAFLVQTREIIDGKKVFGLEDKHVSQAVEILNQFDE